MVRRKETYRLSLLISFIVGETGVSLDLLLLREARAHVLDEVANPKIVSVPKRKPVRLAACARPVHKVVSTRKLVVRQPKELTKSQLNEMLAEAGANTARLLR